MELKLESGWKTRLKEEFEKPYFKSLADFVRAAYLSDKKVYPDAKNIFAALDAVSFGKVRVVILGQDPYHGPTQAQGLSFSVPADVPLPPSLRNIYKEIRNDLGTEPPRTGDLTGWTQQGVLLLNATLTVEAGRAGSHQGKGWEEFTDAAISALNTGREGLVFMLWGAYAQKKGSHIDCSKHLVLTAPHPSPLSAHAGFFGCRHFSKANKFLVKHGRAAINWSAD